MKRLSDLTEEQAIEIAKLIYPYFGEMETEYEFQYQQYDPSWFEDARECARVKFKGITFGNKVDKLMMEIDKNLSCWFYYCREDGVHDLPTHNQCAIQRKFIEWGFEPDYTE